VTGRGVKNDMVYKGVTMKAGDPILSPVILGNLDERRFPDPMKIDFARKNISKSLSFGAGFHRCIGATLGRMQLQVFLEQWLKRIPDFSLVEDDAPVVSCGTAMAITHLPLQW
jgi:cytochrome P450